MTRGRGRGTFRLTFCLLLLASGSGFTREASAHPRLGFLEPLHRQATIQAGLTTTGELAAIEAEVSGALGLLGATATAGFSRGFRASSDDPVDGLVAGLGFRASLVKLFTGHRATTALRWLDLFVGIGFAAGGAVDLGELRPRAVWSAGAGMDLRLGTTGRSWLPALRLAYRYEGRGQPAALVPAHVFLAGIGVAFVDE